MTASDDEAIHKLESPIVYRQSVHTSVSIAKSGFHVSGGMILQIPNLLASGAIFFIYSKGSLNSSSVGRYVGASCKPYSRIFLPDSRLAVG